jgi:hypothetical protein
MLPFVWVGVCSVDRTRQNHAIGKSFAILCLNQIREVLGDLAPGSTDLS